VPLLSERLSCLEKRPADFETDKIGEAPMKELTHFIDGKHANGTSGRFCDGFEPMTGEAISRVPLASKTEVRVAGLKGSRF
jgi:hypothetical protein